MRAYYRLEGLGLRCFLSFRAPSLTCHARACMQRAAADADVAHHQPRSNRSMVSCHMTRMSAPVAPPPLPPLPPPPPRPSLSWLRSRSTTGLLLFRAFLSRRRLRRDSTERLRPERLESPLEAPRRLERSCSRWALSACFVCHERSSLRAVCRPCPRSASCCTAGAAAFAGAEEAAAAASSMARSKSSGTSLSGSWSSPALHAWCSAAPRRWASAHGRTPRAQARYDKQWADRR